MAIEFQNITNFAPPRCPKHPMSSMILDFYLRPGSPPGNGWYCQQCAEERKSVESGSLKHAKTRWPEGAEL